MVEIGLLHPDEPYELIDGELLYVSPQNPPHAKVIGRLTTHLVLAYGLQYRVRVQMPIGGIADSIPEPDLAVVTVNVDEQDRHARADETLLIIEVSDTSVPRDVRRGSIYAAAGAPSYWLVDVGRQIVTVHTGPTSDGAWRDVTEVGLDGRLDLPGIDTTLPVAAVLRAAPRRTPFGPPAAGPGCA